MAQREQHRSASRSPAAIVLAAGRSTRFRSSQSKLVHPLGGKPMIQWLLGAVREAGASPVVVVLGHGAEEVKAACGAGIVFAYQKEQRGTGHAVLAAAPSLAGFSGDVLVLYADLPLLRVETLRRLIETHRRTGATLTVTTAVLANPHGWGRIVRDEDGRVMGIVEERDADAEIRGVREVNVGLYCMSAKFLFDALHEVKPDNAQGEIYLTDIVAVAVRRGASVADAPVDASEVGQINSRGELAEMEKSLRTRINQKWMDAGVTLEDPDTTYIGPHVKIGRDTALGPNVQLRGKTTLGEGCRVDGTALLNDATLGNNVHLRFGVVINESEIADNCQVGPFANLRPGTRLAPDVHIGDFVETKKALIGTRSKANHLAYLGDVEIGSDTNIGAGTITCNYDGFRKHRTKIGDRVQVGSDSQLVAPVTLADDVYVATGTTVRRDVPAGALVFNDKPERHREGWVAERRAREAASQAGKPTSVSRAVHKTRAPKAKKARPTSRPAARKPARAQRA
jgi:bifunctional UDP-N-acetylglucosamine pyrophosphorylase/glucosamine-1-phosphate N-acetyltransferase